MSFLIEHQWTIFIVLEVSSLVFLVLFALVRYAFSKVGFSSLFLSLFFLALLCEALVAYIIFKETGEITTFQVVIALFIIYAVTFGISDFKRLDRYIKQKVGAWRGLDLLTDREKEIIAHLKDPRVIARKSRYWFYAHTLVFLLGMIVLWTFYGNKVYAYHYFFTHFEWFNDELAEAQPFVNDYVTNAVRLWLIIYVVDSIINWSYTLFPSKENE